MRSFTFEHHLSHQQICADRPRKAASIRPRTFVLFAFLLAGCIGDDIILDQVDPIIRIQNAVDTIQVNSSYQFEYTFFNNVGQEETNENVTWSSSDPGIVEIDQHGLATALRLGTVRIRLETASEGIRAADEIDVHVGSATVVSSEDRSGSLRTTSSYVLEGDFTLGASDGTLQLTLASNYRASSSLPGLYLYLTNNPNSISNALEVGAVSIFQGAHSYKIAGAQLEEYGYLLYYCKPFRVKVGDGQFDN